MARGRVHRLPTRLDFTLIPAPLDLSLQNLADKSPIPALIVTPSSPSSTNDYLIAYLPSPSKPTYPSVRERISLYSHVTQLQLRARGVFVILMVCFIVLCHVATHRIATHRPHMDFTSAASGETEIEQPFVSDWFDLRSIWGPSAAEGKRNFVVTAD